ncbi:MAG: agmatine deiminase family protein [Thermodesulfobacteriota bacterium]
MKNNIYRLPPEWEKHEATWLVWPQNSNDWPGKFSPIKWVYAEIVKNICESELVRIVVDSEKVENMVKSILGRADICLDNVEFIIAATDRSWIRDSGPFFVFDEYQNVKMLDFGFNAWAKYSNWHEDNKVPSKIARFLNLPSASKQDVILEGGGIDVNGKGTLITTKQCLLNENKQVRNPGFKKKDYEELFKKYFEITNVLWLGEGIYGDDTNGHVDDLCRFVNPKTVVICEEKNQSDDNYYPLNENIERLEDMKLQDGSRVEVITIPMPMPRYFDSCRLPASYANFYIANEIVLVPTFNDANDYKALGILSELFSEKRVVGINCTDLIWGLGGIHCLTKEQPVLL